jgi:glycosyltransferase involved in cell wall biosynthesis
MIITIPSFGLGKTGGDRMLTSIANNLVARGHAVNVVNLGNKPLPFPLSDQVNVIRALSRMDGSDPVGSLLKGMNRIASALPPSDIYLANWVYTVLPCIANNDRGKTVFLAQANEAKDFNGKSMRVLNGISYEAYRLNVPIIVPSTYLGDVLRNRFGSETTVIPPAVVQGLSGGTEKRKDDGVVRLLYVGSMTKANKGFGIFVGACRKLRRVGFEFHVATSEIVGIKTTGDLSDFIIHHPKDDRELKQLYQDSDIFLHLSKEEGFGLTLLEAMANGCVCIATDAGGNMDFSVDGGNCVIIERNTKTAVLAIRRVSAGLDGFRRSLVPNAIRTSGRYSEARMADSLEKLFVDHLSACRK